MITMTYIQQCSMSGLDPKRKNPGLLKINSVHFGSTNPTQFGTNPDINDIIVDCTDRNSARLYLSQSLVLSTSTSTISSQVNLTVSSDLVQKLGQITLKCGHLVFFKF